MADWSIELNKWEGYVPGYFGATYPIIGNSGHARSMLNVDLTDPHSLTQGPGLANLTDGTQATAVTTLIKGMAKSPVSAYAYAVGGNKVYRMESTLVTNDANYPHTIDKGTVTGEDGEDCIFYQSALYYSYNHSGGAGDVGRGTGTATFDDDYMSTVPTGAAALVGGVPHPMEAGGDDILYIGNGRYVATLNGTTFTNQALDLPTYAVIVDLVWSSNRIFAAANKGNLTGANNNPSSIFVWDTVSSSWEQEIYVGGRIGALNVRNGIVYVWYEDLTGVQKFGYVNGNQIEDLVFYSGTLPLYYQVSEYKNHIMWVNGEKISAWGAVSNDVPIKYFDFADGGYATVGGLSVPFGTPLIASTDGATNYRLAKFSGYDVTCNWKTIFFQIGNATQKGIIRRIVVFTDPLSSGAKLDTTLQYDFAKSNKSLIQIAYSTANKTKWKILEDGPVIENFALDFSWANGSATNPVKIRSVYIEGDFIPHN